MPECNNCGSTVSPTYVRVLEPDGRENPAACPRCPDLLRVDGAIRESRARRH